MSGSRGQPGDTANGPLSRLGGGNQLDSKAIEAFLAAQDQGTGPRASTSFQSPTLTPYSRPEGRTTGPALNTGPVDAMTGQPARVGSVTPYVEPAPKSPGFGSQLMSALQGPDRQQGGGVPSYAAQGAEGARQAMLANSEGRMYAPGPLQKKKMGGAEIDMLMKLLAGA